MLKPLDAHFKNMALALSDDGDNLFNQETRHFPPIQYMLPSKRWLRQKYVSINVPIISRPYADKHNVPPHYVIMDASCLTQLSEKDISKAIVVNCHQMAVPMKLFFKQNDFCICSQWEFIRMYYKHVPELIRKEQGVARAFYLSMEMDWYDELKSLFYDLKTDNPDEYERRLQMLIDKEKELKRQMDECQNLIRIVKLNKEYGWNDRWDELYDMYSSSKEYKDGNFYRFCKYYFEEDSRMWAVFWDIKRAGTDAWKIAKSSSKFFELKSKYEQARYDKESFLMYYTLEI